jgi:ABC-type uncharacterized transport system substrate-binding protein
VNDRFGEVANWLVLFACLISAGNAASRYLFSASSNAWLEVQWYMFAAWCCWAALILSSSTSTYAVHNAGTSREIEAAFATFVVERRDALYVGNEPFFNSRRVQMVHLASYHRIPATYSSRDFAEAGGLMGYGSNITDAWRLAGAYAGRILRGAKPADLPVVQSSKFELVINAQTARMLGLTVPPTLLVQTTDGAPDLFQQNG